MSLDFKGKNVLVTGGSRNIGKGIVECFLETGANVVFTFHGSEARAEQTRQELLHDAPFGNGFRPGAGTFFLFPRELRQYCRRRGDL